ncbi:MAG: asparagine synthase (glutamine-hydrolyzing) [Proteobacteria bacterium]|nr:asparagine synthase (glutamine-hydrolyzing) [Pseudomonadota bacterium]
MCGINGIFAYHSDAPPVSRGAVARVRDAMAARGPDAAGKWFAADGRVGFGHRRLTIIDLSPGASQPMLVDGGRLAITYNGEIYNYRALRDELIAEGRVFKTQSDTEVILHLYDRDGPAMVEKLRGMFAFALWDAERRGVLLARDPFGIKPLYVADDGRTLRFASQVKALLAGGGINTAPDPAGHAGFFLLGSVPDPHTLYAGIRALPAGSTVWVDATGVGAAKRYFHPSDILAQTGGVAADLGEALRDSVKHHLVADVPVGVFLSAGRDSTTIAALAAEAGDAANLDTITLAFDEFRGLAMDEAPLAETVAARLGSRHVTRRLTGAAFHDERDHLLTAMDQPTLDGVNTYFVAKCAREAGLKVALSGTGGDEMFGGYDTFTLTPRLVAAMGWIPGGARLGTVLRKLAMPLAGKVGPAKALSLLEFGTGYGDAYMLQRGLYMPWELPRVMDADMARDGLAALNLRHRLDETQAAVGLPRRKIIALEMAWYMKNQLLRDTDWAGMAHGLEIRTPLVDAFLFRALAPALGVVGGPDKAAMAQTPHKPLPDAVLNRPKTGFSVPVRDWMQAGAGDGGGERGLRGWARTVYGAFTAA